MKHEGEAGAEKEEGKESEEKRKGEEEEGYTEEGRKRERINYLLVESGERSSHNGTQESPGAECMQPQFMSSARSFLICSPKRAERLLYGDIDICSDYIWSEWEGG